MSVRCGFGASPGCAHSSCISKELGAVQFLRLCVCLCACACLSSVVQRHNTWECSGAPCEGLRANWIAMCALSIHNIFKLVWSGIYTTKASQITCRRRHRGGGRMGLIWTLLTLISLQTFHFVRHVGCALTVRCRNVCASSFVDGSSGRVCVCVCYGSISIPSLPCDNLHSHTSLPKPPSESCASGAQTRTHARSLAPEKGVKIFFHSFPIPFCPFMLTYKQTRHCLYVQRHTTHTLHGDDTIIIL